MATVETSRAFQTSLAVLGQNDQTWRDAAHVLAMAYHHNQMGFSKHPAHVCALRRDAPFSRSGSVNNPQEQTVLALRRTRTLPLSVGSRLSVR